MSVGKGFVRVIRNSGAARFFIPAGLVPPAIGASGAGPAVIGLFEHSEYRRIEK